MAGLPTARTDNRGNWTFNNFIAEPLEPRTYMSLVYEQLPVFPDVGAPHELATGYHGPIAVLDDIDGDGVRDLLVGNTGSEQTSHGTVEFEGAAVISGARGDILRAYEPFSNST